jgi:hypothetical protein
MKSELYPKDMLHSRVMIGSRRAMQTTVAAVAVFAALTSSLTAQRATKRVFVEVVDEEDQPVTGLTAADFELLEDNAPREVTRLTPGTVPMRVVLLVDSSTSTQPMIAMFRKALDAFADQLPPQHEISFITSGSQIRVRTEPSTDRQKLKAQIGLLQSEGGANAFLETLIEADQRFLKPASGTRWPVIVILTTDIGEARREPDVPRYNRFMNDYLGRGGSAHAIIMQGRQFGPVTDLTQNFVQNMGGMYLSLIVDSGLPDRMRSIAERLASDHLKMATWSELEFAGDAQHVQPIIKVDVRREGLRVRMSPRRPF